MAHGVERRPRCISTGARPRRHWAARCLGGLAIAGLLAASAPLGADEGKPKTTEDLLAELLKQTQAQNELLAKQAKQIEDLQKKVNDVLMRASPPGAPGGAMGAIPHVDPPVSRASAVPLREAPLAPVGPATASGLPGLVGYPRTATREGYIATETYGRSYSPSNSAYLTRPTDSERGAQMEALDVDLMTSRAHSVDGMGRVSAPGFFTQRQVRVVRDGRSVKYLPVEPDEYGWAAASGERP